MAIFSWQEYINFTEADILLELIIFPYKRLPGPPIKTFQQESTTKKNYESGTGKEVICYSYQSCLPVPDSQEIFFVVLCVLYYRGRPPYELRASLRAAAAGCGHRPSYTLLDLCYHAVSLLPEVYFFTMFPGIFNANFLLLFLNKKFKFSVL